MNGAGEPVDAKTKAVYLDDNIETAGIFEDAFANFTAIDLQKADWSHKLEQALEGAELIITDWNLDRMEKGTFQPGDGKALNEVLRARQRKNPVNPLYTIFSGKLEDVPDLEHHQGRPHVLAQDLDADWVGSKDHSSEFRQQLLLLTKARNQLRENSPPPENVVDYLRSLFALVGNPDWSEEALNEIERFQPPIQHLFGTLRDERIFIRWMTRIVFPYPTFLLDSYEVSVRLALEPKSTNRLLSDETNGLSRALIRVRYSGILAGFSGERWWRAGINDWIWRLTDGNPYDRERVRQALVKLTDGQTTFVDQRDPVLLRDERGRTMDDDLVADASEAVRIQPDEWPASAPWPWARVDAVLKEPLLRAIVFPDDQHRLTRKS